MSSHGRLDETSERIIEQLQRNGRLSYADLAKAVGLSEAAVRQRVQRLTDSRLAEPDRLGEIGVRQATVALQLLDDPLGGLIEPAV